MKTRLLLCLLLILCNVYGQWPSAGIEMELRRRGIPVTVDETPPLVPEAIYNLSQFHEAYNTFYRKAFGCPAKGQGDCAPLKGEWDAKRWKHVCRLAEKAFGGSDGKGKRRR